MYVIFLISGKGKMWNWIDQDQISNLSNLKDSYENRNFDLIDFSVLNYNNPRNQKKNQSEIQKEDNNLNNIEKLYILKQNNPEITEFPQYKSKKKQSQEIEKILDIIQNNGVLKFKVLNKGSDHPIIISYSELRSKNSHLLLEWFGNSLAQ